jgi:hypothetical protein
VVLRTRRIERGRRNPPKQFSSFFLLEGSSAFTGRVGRGALIFLTNGDHIIHVPMYDAEKSN